jgi:hypothetical protein
MANHKAWMDLPIVIKIELVGKIAHLLQNQYPYYLDLLDIISKAEDQGLFDDVIINNSNEGNS